MYASSDETMGAPQNTSIYNRFQSASTLQLTPNLRMCGPVGSPYQTRPISPKNQIVIFLPIVLIGLFISVLEKLQLDRVEPV